MNGIITTKIQDVTILEKRFLPADKRRILFISGDTLGWKTFGHTLADYTAHDERIWAALVYVDAPLVDAILAEIQ
jgi:hypothetical protein